MDIELFLQNNFIYFNVYFLGIKNQQTKKKV